MNFHKVLIILSIVLPVTLMASIVRSEDISISFTNSVSNVFGGDSVGHGNKREFNVTFQGKPFTVFNGYCFLTGAGGKMTGINDLVGVKLIENSNQWQLFMRGHGIQGFARCIHRP